MDLRCPSKKFAVLDEGVIQITCPSRFCGKRPDVTVLHVFSTSTGELLDTRRFRTPKGRN